MQTGRTGSTHSVSDSHGTQRPLWESQTGVAPPQDAEESQRSTVTIDRTLVALGEREPFIALRVSSWGKGVERRKVERLS
jgi:hypothetical protein